ncbi:hypothetical protein [Methylocystis parvus]|uniref:hypothetical protein n=1 Tax=Methylocystis parvus TaxID=134 RepID=UPI003C76D90F
MSELERGATAGFLREVLKRRAQKLTWLAETLEIPYRSLQNYFGKTDMPLWVYERICKQAGLDPAYAVKKGQGLVERGYLAEALYEVMGDKLPIFNENDLRIDSPSDLDRRTVFDLRRDAQILAVLVAGRYDLVAERDVAAKPVPRE